MGDFKATKTYIEYGIKRFLYIHINTYTHTLKVFFKTNFIFVGAARPEKFTFFSE